MSTFTSILNKCCEEVMKLGLNFSFSSSFFGSFYESSLSLDFLYDPTFELEPKFPKCHGHEEGHVVRDINDLFLQC
jgi:hypothetical protein